MDVEITEPARAYYDRTDLGLALAVVLERIDEWDYETDAHGYCHDRPALVALVRALEDRGVTLPRTAYRDAGGRMRDPSGG